MGASQNFANASRWGIDENAGPEETAFPCKSS